jgi:hypothetical protein
MPLREPDPPQASVTAVNEAIRSMGAQRAFSADALLEAKPEEVQLGRRHEVYVLGLDDLLDERKLEHARPSGWRYVVSVGGLPIALAETVTQADGGHAFAHLNYGPFVAGTVEALSVADREAAEKQADVRVLHVPALYVQALWLHTEGDDEGTLVPIAPAPPGIEVDRAYPEHALLDELRARARAVPIMDEGDTRGG